MKRLFAFLLASCIAVLCACTPKEEPQTEPSSNPQQTQESTQPSSQSTQPSTQTTEPEMLYRNPITGEPMEAQVLARPFALSLNNSKPAMPQHGIGAADIVFETVIEGETRCVGIFYNLNENTAETLGTIRSARYYLVEIAQAFDAIYVHNGTSSDPEIGAKEYFKETGWEHMDAISTKGAYKYYYRDRKDQGYSYEHTLFIKPQGILSLAKDLKFTTSREKPLDLGQKFDDNTVIVGDTANTVKVRFVYCGKTTNFQYNAKDKLYYVSQFGKPYEDGNTNQQIAFRNVLILRTDISRKTGSELMKVDTIGTGTGYFICNGQMVEINWSREKATDPFVYTLAANGQEVTFGVGKTYVAFVPQKAVIDIE